MTIHLVLETADSLLYSYEHLALKHRKNEGGKQNYKTTFPLLILNASIVEGILRYWLANSIKETMEDMIKQGTAAGQTRKNKAELLLEEYLIEVEGNGGFEKLKAQYNFFFTVPLDAKSSTYDQDAIRALFTLRNVLAHGTALVAPKVPASSPNKQNYVDSWQSKLQVVTVLLKKLTGAADIFHALDDYSIPLHFFEQSKLFLQEIRSKLPATMKESEAHKAMQALRFGYRHRLLR
ncbi:hypothetical protein PQQ51_33035 [Paraburkholderia xenovorans]|uniref:hypothetical protein n=1 Tax=Paraburkholderia xenovorans TaxID=36873 RepID=UPI0038BD0EEA